MLTENYSPEGEWCKVTENQRSWSATLEFYEEAKPVQWWQSN